MQSDWKAIIADNIHFIIDCLKLSGVEDGAVALADAEQMRDNLSPSFAEVMQARGADPAPLMSKQGHKIMLVYLPRTALEKILSNHTESFRPLRPASGTLKLWAACFDPDEFSVMDIHQAAPEHN